MKQSRDDSIVEITLVQCQLPEEIGHDYMIVQSTDISRTRIVDTSYNNNSRDKVTMGVRVHKVYDTAGSHTPTMTDS